MQGSWEGKLGNVAVMRKSKRTSLLGASGSASLALPPTRLSVQLFAVPQQWLHINDVYIKHGTVGNMNVVLLTKYW